MATYLQGVTDYIPQIQPFTPDYNFYSGALDLKQSKYDAARKQLSNLYGSLLNAPLTRDDNAASRDKFFKTIEQDIQKMATMDLSLRQNQEAAAGVFNQILDNKAIRKDMVWTKNFQSQVQRSKGFKNCVDPEKCGGQWWEGGDRLMNYSYMEFKNASAEEALNFGDVEYTPYQDITKKAMELAKEADLNVSMDQVTGQWITTTKNGPLIVKPLADLLQGSIGNDPKVQEYYKANSRLKRKDFMYGNKDQYGSLEAAEQAYIQTMAPKLEEFFGIKGEQLKEEVANTESKQKKLEDKKGNALPEEQRTIEQVQNDLENRKNAYSQTLEQVEQNNGIAKVARANQKYSGADIDNMYASFELGTKINGLAQDLAYRDYEQSVKENPYGLEAVKQANRMAMEQMRFEHDRLLNYEKFQQEVMLYESGYKGGGGGGGAAGVPPVGTAENNNPEIVQEVAGGTDVGSTDELSPAYAERSFRAFNEEFQGTRTDLSANERVLVKEVMDRTKTAALNGDAQAKEDYVRMFENYVAASGSSTGAITRSDKDLGEMMAAVGKKGKRMELEAIANSNMTIDQKFAEIQKSGALDLAALKGEQIDGLYKSTVSDMYNMSNASNGVLRDYLKPVWESTADLRAGIQSKDIALEQMSKYVGEQNKELAAKTAANWSDKMGYSAKFWGDAVTAYVDESTGATVDQETFVNNMTAMGHSASDAKEIYRADRTKTYDDASGWEYAGAVAETAGELGWNLLKFGTVVPALVDWAIGDDDVWTAEMPETNLNEDAVAGKAMPGIFDVYKRSFSQYAKPTSEAAFLGLGGTGDKSAMAARYQLDAAAYRSVATTATIGFLKDALKSKDAKFDFGGFSTSYENDDDAKRMAAIVLSDIVTNKGKNRLITDVTYSNIAEGNKNKVALNIKLPEAFSKSWKGSEDEPGPARNRMGELASSGFTIIMDKSATDNVFTQGATNTPYENLMKWRGQIDFDQNPDYTKNTKLQAVDGKYVFSGQLKNGIDENGNAVWTNIRPIEFDINTDVNSHVQRINEIIKNTVYANQLAEQEYLANRK